jgi:hypothetical protein
MIVEHVLPGIVCISMNVHGTRSVQSLVDILSKKLTAFEKEILLIISALEPLIKELSLNVHGNHVI